MVKFLKRNHSGNSKMGGRWGKNIASLGSDTTEGTIAIALREVTMSEASRELRIEIT